MRSPGREQGAITVMLALMLVTLIALMGFALDLAHAYNRRADLQGVADAAAMAAARALDGSVAGVGIATDKARQMVEGNFYNSRGEFTWSSAMLRFAEDPDATESGWIDAGAINSSNVARIRYARIDTAGLDDDSGEVRAVLMGILKPGHRFALRAVAVAGKATVHVTPLGICAIDHTRYTQRVHNAGVNNELVEHGFRRGVGYNLFNLNPHGTSPASFLLNPVDQPPRTNIAAHLNADFVKPYVCAGTLAVPAAGDVYVTQPFPSTLIQAFNARFNQFGSGLCKAQAAPPDINIQSYGGAQPAGWWMNGVPTAPSAKAAIENGRLLTIADTAISNPLPARADMGTLWSYAKPVAYDASAPNHAGAEFAKTDWPYLYPATPGLASSYAHAVLPYLSGVNAQTTASPVLGQRFRRILYVPLLACPVAGSEATVLGIGKFMMTTPATSSPLALHAEFGGLAREGELTHSVVLYK